MLANILKIHALALELMKLDQSDQDSERRDQIAREIMELNLKNYHTVLGMPL